MALLPPMEQVTHKLQDAVDALQKLHSKIFGGTHPVYCMRPLLGRPEHPICGGIEMYNEDMDKCLGSFTKNYKYMVDRTPKRRTYE